MVLVSGRIVPEPNEIASSPYDDVDENPDPSARGEYGITGRNSHIRSRSSHERMSTSRFLILSNAVVTASTKFRSVSEADMESLDILGKMLIELRISGCNRIMYLTECGDVRGRRHNHE